MSRVPVEGGGETMDTTAVSPRKNTLFRERLSCFPPKHDSFERLAVFSNHQCGVVCLFAASSAPATRAVKYMKISQSRRRPLLEPSPC